MLFQESLSIADGVHRWCAAASTAGAMLPAYVQDFIQRLDWDAEGDERVDMYDIVEAVTDACRECQEQHVDDCDGTYFPCPRGVSVHCSPNGGVDIVWDSDSHNTVLRFVAESRDRATMVGGFANHGSGLRRDYVVLLCETEHEDSDRLRACRGELVSG